MKNVIDYIGKEQVNEGLELLSTYDLSLVVVLSTTLSYLISMGFSITGRMVNKWIHSKNKDRHGSAKVANLQKLKEFSRRLNIDTTDLPQVKSVLNNPGEWTTEMLAELRSAFYDKLTPEQQKEYDQLEKSYTEERNKFVLFK